jgi:predicted ATPase with chaperone activity
MDYYHGPKMEKLFKYLEQPRTLEELNLSESFIKDLILKIVSSFGTVKTSVINEITGIHWDIMEKVLNDLEKGGFCAPTSGGFLFSSIQFTITQKGREKARGVTEENPYIGIAPVAYEDYYTVMELQMKDRYPIKIPSDVVEYAFKDIVGVNYAKECMMESCTIGKGIFVYGSPGTGKTFIISKMPELLPPLVIPKFIEFSGRVIQLYDQDFHKKCEEQPQDPRWVKIYAPFVITGAELSLNKLETNYDANKGVYETSPIIKANGGILLIDDLGRQRDDHEMILNRLIVPMENKKDAIYVRGIPVIVHTHFIPAFSTNLDISIMDEAHLRRAPLHIFLMNPNLDDVVEVFRRNMELLDEDYDEGVLERFRKVYETRKKGGEGLEPSFAHARDVAQIAQSVRIIQNKDLIDIPILEEALNKHVLIVLQRMNIDIAQISNKIRTFRVKTGAVEEAYQALEDYSPIKISSESNAVVVDLEENKTPAELLEYLKEQDIPVDNVEVIAESEKELRRTILEHYE